MNGRRQPSAPSEQLRPPEPQIQCPLGIKDVLYDDIFSQLNAVSNTCRPMFTVQSLIAMEAYIKAYT